MQDYTFLPPPVWFTPLSIPVVGYLCLGRAYGNLGLSHESLGNYEEAVQCQEQHLGTANQTGDRAAKTLALSSLGMYLDSC